MRKSATPPLVHRVIEAVPGKRIFGLYRFQHLSLELRGIRFDTTNSDTLPFCHLELCYCFRFLPFFFALGAALEFSMINWTVR